MKNATSLWSNSRNDRHQFGLSWAKQFDRADPARQSAALDVLNASIPFGSACVAKVSDRTTITHPLFSSIPTQKNEAKLFDLSFHSEESQDEGKSLTSFLAIERSLK